MVPREPLATSTLVGVDAVVHLAGAAIGDRRWTQSRTRELVSSRLDGTGTIARAISSIAESAAPSRLLSGSAIGFYGERGTEVLTEESDQGEGFLADLCRD